MPAGRFAELDSPRVEMTSSSADDGPIDHTAAVESQPHNRLLGHRRKKKLGDVGPILHDHGNFNIILDAPPFFGMRRDPYHFVLALPFPVMLLTFAGVYCFCWVIFAPVYMAINDRCDLQSVGTFRAAVYYSLITMSTIGFGTNDMTFAGCWEAMVVIMIQTLLGTLGAPLARARPRDARPVTRVTLTCARRVFQ